ncbi:TPA: porin [Burkholderia cepacia ATCC 25416]|nr:porin [Burkholderia cepacia ATCC 25416]HDV6371962.1 porin [Burkholderia cepacia]
MMWRRFAATFALTASCGSAFAQSSITLYGVIDEGLDFANNSKGHQLYAMTQGDVQRSRFGFKGEEDLGAGLAAIFTLEGGVDVNSGKESPNGRIFGRQSFFGLRSNSWGTLTLGRQYDSLVDYLQRTTGGAFGGLFFMHPYDNDNLQNAFRVNNTAKYTSPELLGFRFGGTYSFSNSTGFSDNRVMSVGGQYAAGGLLVGFGFLNADRPGRTSVGAIAGPDASGAANDANFVADHARIFGVGVSYAIGAATIRAGYSNSDFVNPVSSVFVGSIVPVTANGPGSVSNLRFQNAEISGVYAISPSIFAGAQYSYTLANFKSSTVDAKPQYHTISLMADYFLSKRTDVYAQVAYRRVAGSKTGTILDYASILVASPSSIRSQLAVRLALRHKF